jgi:hypothetical protein
MTVIPARCFLECTSMTTVDCDLSNVTSIGANAFYNCTSLLPPSLSAMDADPAAVLGEFMKGGRAVREGRGGGEGGAGADCNQIGRCDGRR